MSSDAGLTQAELLQRGRDKLAAFRQAKAATRAQEASALQELDRHMQMGTANSASGEQQTQQTQQQSQQPQPQMNGHAHEVAPSQQQQPQQQQQSEEQHSPAQHPVATQQQQQQSLQHSQQPQHPVADGQPLKAEPVVATQPAEPAPAAAPAAATAASAAPTRVSVEEVLAMQQQYTQYWAQYGSDPQYAAYFQQLLAQIQQAQEYLRQQQQQQLASAATAAPVHPAVDSAPAVQSAPADAAPVVQPAVPDYSSSATLQSFTPEQRASFLGFAQYYHDPQYASYYAQMAQQPEYASYFATMEVVLREVQQAQQQTAHAAPTAAQQLEQQQQTQQQLAAPEAAQSTALLEQPLETVAEEPAETVAPAVAEIDQPQADISSYFSPSAPQQQSSASSDAAAVSAQPEEEPSVKAEAAEPAPFADSRPEPEQPQQSEQQSQPPQQQSSNQPEQSFSGETASSIPYPSADAAPAPADTSLSSQHDVSSSLSSSAAPSAPLSPVDRSPSPSAAELPSTFSLDLASESSTSLGEAGADERGSASPVLLHSRQISTATEASSVAVGDDRSLQDEEMPALEGSDGATDMYTLPQQQLHNSATPLAQVSAENGIAPTHDVKLEASPPQPQQSFAADASSTVADASTVDPARAAVLDELQRLRQALQAKDDEIQHLSSSLPPAQHTGALMSSSSELRDEPLSGEDATRSTAQVHALSQTVSSLSREIDSLRAENERLFHQQSLLRRDVGERNARMEQVQHDNVALLLEMENLERENADLNEKLNEAAEERQARANLPMLSPGSGTAGSLTCDHGSTFAELHELQLQVAPVWQKSLDLTQALDEALRELHHSCALALQGGVDPRHVQLLTAGLPTGVSATPAGTSSSSAYGAETSEYDPSRPRSNSDPNVAPAMTAGEDQLQLTDSSSGSSQQTQSESGMTTPPRKDSSTALVAAAAAVPTLSAITASVSGVHELLRAKRTAEAQLYALLRRVQELCEPVATLLAAGGGSGGLGSSDPAGVQRTLKALQKKTLAHAHALPSAAASSSSSAGPGAVAIASPSTSLLQAQVSELRASRDQLHAQLAAQVERAHLLIKDKILLAKKIEDTYEERQIVVENLREEIASLKKAAAASGSGERKRSSGSRRHSRDASSSSAPVTPEQRYHERYDSALSPEHASGSTVPSSASAAYALAASADGSVAPASASSDLLTDAAHMRDLNSFYVHSTRQPQPSPAVRTPPPTAPAAPTPAAPASPLSSDEDDEEAEAERERQRQQQGLFSSLISFFRVRFSQAAYEELLRDAQRRKRRQQRLKSVAVVAI